MKIQTTNSRNIRKLTTATCLLFSFSVLLSMTLQNTVTYSFNNPVDFAIPDTILPDSSAITDTVNVTAIYSVSDTAEIFTDGLDSIIFLQEDTTLYFAQQDTTQTYILGEVAEGVVFNKPNDTLAYYYVTDTAAYFIPENDTSAYQLFPLDSTTLVEGRVNTEELNLLTLTMKLGIPISTIDLGGNPKWFNKNLLGINTSGMFDQSTLPNELGVTTWSPTTELQWDWLSDLQPEVLRFPHGSLNKFMHILHTIPSLDDGDPLTNVKSTGYGYDFDEILRYFDLSDGIINCPDPVATLLTQNYVANWPNWITWMQDDATHQLAHLFDNYIGKYNDQLTATTNYLDDFLRLILKIQTAHPEHKVNVVLCLNILSEPAPECVAIVQYMMDFAQNGIVALTPDQIAGIELGSEVGTCPFSYFLDIHSFDDAGDGNYWDYINGDIYTDATQQANLETLLGAAMNEEDGSGNNVGHDYITAFKGSADPDIYNLKLGVPAGPITGIAMAVPDDPAGEYGFGPLEDLCPTDVEWNPSVRDHYNDVEGLTGRKKFDAVILHTYYMSDAAFLSDGWAIPSRWSDILNNNLCDAGYPSIGLPGSCTLDPLGCDDPPTDKWFYNSYDTRLQDAYDKISGIWQDMSGREHANYYDFITTYYNEALTAYSDIFDFNLTPGIDGKELWVTEWNVNVGRGASDREYVCSNGYMQGFIDFEWVLKNIRVNFNTQYANNFFTLATIQNFAGGSDGDLLTLTRGDNELIYDGITDVVGEGFEYYHGKNYYRKRIIYHAFDLLSEISKNDLNYLPSNHLIPVGSGSGTPEIPVTVFIDHPKTYLYIYVSNRTDKAHCYTLNKTRLEDALGYLIYFDEPPVVYGVDAQQLYSTAGLGNTFEINTCYNDDYPINLHEDDVVGGESHNIGLITEPDPYSWLPQYHFTVPARSFGYAKIHLWHVIIHKDADSINLSNGHECMLYPNPANSAFYIEFTSDLNSNGNLTVEIYSLSGEYISSQLIGEHQPVNIASLPVGLYLVKIRTDTGFEINKTLVKS